jgi:hypothetical protein
MVDANEEGLEAKVDVLGSNFSLGTQQLICLARAMLNPSRILLLDEATAALDSDTNVAVQHVLKAHFSDRTIFTIAHRLDTIIDNDRILVMNAGVVAEFDRPDVLLAKPDSIFYELCKNTGTAQFSVLAAKAFDPDIWMITSYLAANTLFLKTADALNFRPKAIVLVGAGDAKSLFDAVGAKVATGVMVVAYTTPLVNPTFAPLIGKFWTAYEAKFKVKPLGTVASTGYTGMIAALRMIDAAGGKVDPASFGAAAKTITVPLGGQPNGFGIKMDADRQNTAIRLLAVQWRADGTVPAVWPDAAQLPGEAVKLAG